MRFILIFFALSLPSTIWAAEREPSRAKHYMVASANPLASEAGRRILEEGGTAVDAAIAVQAVLSLVEPQSSGIGGGGFLLHFDPLSGELQSFDGRETAPAGLDPTLFLDEKRERLGFIEAALGGAAVGTPGVLRMLEAAHKEHGHLPWARLFEEAERLARKGFALSPRLHEVASGAARRFSRLDFDLAQLGPISTYLFTEQGEAKPVGTLLKNPEYARTMRAIAEKGAEAFYTGPIAQAMVETVQQAQLRPGWLSLEDLATYKPTKRTPVCGTYRNHMLCSMGPPSSGGTTLLSILGLLEGYDLAHEGGQTLTATHLFAEASRLAFADRNRFSADSDFIPVPVKGLIDPHYLSLRRQLIDRETAAEEVTAGPVPRETASVWGDHSGYDYPATSHMSIVDEAGRVVSFTTTVQIAFGSFLMVEGFLLNNQLTDFSFQLQDEEGRSIANRPAPLKRPRSSMTPVIALDSNRRFDFAIGSPGGSSIINYVAKTIIGLVDWELPMQEAINLPNLVASGTSLRLEAETDLEALVKDLETMGHQIRVSAMTSGLHGIQVIRDETGTLQYYQGGADPRREGTAIGK